MVAKIAFLVAVLFVAIATSDVVLKQYDLGQEQNDLGAQINKWKNIILNFLDDNDAIRLIESIENDPSKYMNDSRKAVRRLAELTRDIIMSDPVLFGLHQRIEYLSHEKETCQRKLEKLRRNESFIQESLKHLNQKLSSQIITHPTGFGESILNRINRLTVCAIDQNYTKSELLTANHSFICNGSEISNHTRRLIVNGTDDNMFYCQNYSDVAAILNVISFKLDSLILRYNHSLRFCKQKND
eukprot:276104_1